MAALITKLCFAIACIFELRKFGRMSGEHLFLLIRIASLLGPLRVLATPSVPLRDVVLAELAELLWSGV